MPRRLLAALLVVFGCGGSSYEPRAIRNVLLVSIDTLRADHLSCYGYAEATSPNIDALAADGVRFELAISTNPITLPSSLV